MTDLVGNNEFCRRKHWDSGETKFTVSQGASHQVICHIAKQNKSKFWKTRWDSGDNIRPPLITCNSGQHNTITFLRMRKSLISVNCFPFDVIVFAMLPTHFILIAKRASVVMTQTRIRQTNWNGGWLWRFHKWGQKPVFLKHLWNENFAYIPCVSLKTRLRWLSPAGNPVICILFLDFVRFAIVRRHVTMK